MDIRPLQNKDREPIHRLLVDTEVFSEEEVAIALELIDVALQCADQKDYIVWTIEADGVVEGYYCIGPTPATLGTFDLYWIAVKPSVHGRGVGGRLISHAEDLIKAMNGRLVVAETSSQPRYEKTRRFYLAKGYSELARIRDYYRPGDDLVMYGKYLT